MHDKVKVTNDQKPKTQILVMYDHTKGRMGVVDLISFHHSARIKSKLWPLNALVFMKYHLKLYQNLLEDKVSFKNFELTYQYGKSLVLTNIQWRLENLNGLRIQGLYKIRHVLALIEVNHRPLPGPENCFTPISCCYKCMEGIVGTNSY